MQYVEYIQNGQEGSRGTGWYIDLGYTPSQTTNVKIKCKVYYPNSQQDGDLFIGCSENGNKKFRFFSFNSEPGKMAFDCPSDNGSARILCNYTGVTEWEFGAIENGNTYMSNLTAGISITGHSNDTRQFNIPFSVWHNGSNNTQGSQVYYIEIYENDVKVKSYLPVLDNSNNPALYEEIGGTYHYNTGNTLTVGPVLSSIKVTASKTTLRNTGETIDIVVTTENAWTVTGDTFLTLSSTGDTGGTTITATAPSYTGVTDRTDTLTFTDTVTSDEVTIYIKQKKYSVGTPLHLGGDEVAECYVGGDAVVEAYLGEDLVYSSGPFTGLKINPKTFTFTPSVTSATLTVKSSEAWTATTVPSWLTASPSNANSGETVVTLTATPETALTTDTLVLGSANFSANASCVYDPVEYVEMANIYEPNVSSFQLTHRLDTGIAHTANTMEIEIEYEGMGGSFSDRMVGYAQNDPGCTSDSQDFRVFGFQSGTFDYMSYRSSFGGNINSGSHHLRIGDCYCYDYATGTYLCQGSTVGSVPSPNCHIYVDVSRIKVKSVKITDGNSTLFDGVAAEKNGVYGLWDKVGNQMITNSDITITGTPISE